EALSPCNASVEDAVRLGADAVGYTLYVGSPKQEEDLAQVGRIRADCDRYGMPLVIWAYPRGRDIEKKGGRDSFYAIDYAARVAIGALRTRSWTRLRAHCSSPACGSRSSLRPLGAPGFCG